MKGLRRAEKKTVNGMYVKGDRRETEKNVEGYNSDDYDVGGCT